MAHGTVCGCGREHMEVIDYRCNYSAFSGYHYTPSDYSAIRCRKCGKVWRSKAAYVDTLPRAKDRGRESV